VCASPAFAEVLCGRLRLLLAGPESSAGRPMPDGRRPEPGGWNRIHFVVDDIEAEVARLREGGVSFRNEIVTGPGGRQILLDDPSGNPAVPDWFPPFLAASLAILLLNLALVVQRRRECCCRWDRRLLRELRAWDGRLPDELSRPRRLR
jgi:Glyoxalase/Bleomycin resistance protein/Dioxygenase superfamily